MPAQATAFTTAPIPAQATAFTTPSLARATVFRTAPLPALATDVTTAFAPDCAYLQAVIPRDLTALDPLLLAVRDLQGNSVPANVISRDEEGTIIRVYPEKDGVYILSVGSPDGNEVTAPLLAFCRALLCFRPVNKQVATGGNNGQGEAPGDKWKQLYADMAMSIACFETGDYPSAQALLDILTETCGNDCHCGC